MHELFLAEPSWAYKAQYIEMLKEWKAARESLIPWVLKLDYSDFGAMVNYLNDLSVGKNLKAGQVECSTFWLLNNNGRMLGVSNIRHKLNEELYEYGGHVGYGIRPCDRSHGYGTEILRLSIEKLKVIGVDKIRITCDESNKPSEKVILKNGGVFDSICMRDNVTVKRFWITVV